ncbi:DUF6232 family protein [Acinetobacter sp. Ac_5812]|uniref:DUF6232 family protein n=1 Tax=Acinetobacter sp. Ac_5812 TaxID=1848937 RepID=UPI00149059C3|nr:DUF6232 family protein [Acinetobacter sp. Ac_5812]NNP68981.1 hypothetical protein [Acinetobacter sp. Ac_5812]
MSAVQKPEQTLFSSGNVSVTNARFIVNNQTYAVRNITSVDKRLKKAPKLGWWICGVIFLLAGISGNNLTAVIIVGLILIGVGFLVKHKYYVVLKTSASELQALESEDENYIDEVIHAINQAILYH